MNVFCRLVLLVPFCCSTPYVLALEDLSDNDLSRQTAQALLSITEANSDVDPSIKFYKVGINAVMEANLNIHKLVLGQDGVNGAGKADIDLDNVALSGNCTIRPDCSAKFINPAMEFAIKNPNTKATRELVGLRFTNEGSEGMVTFGTENTASPNGINTMSGYMQLQSDASGFIKGEMTSKAGFFDAGKYPMQGTMTTLGSTWLSVKFITTSGGFYMPSVSGIKFEKPGIVVNGSRLSQISINNIQLDFPKFYIGWDGSSLNPAGAAGSFPAQGVHDVTNNQVRTQGGPVNARVTSCAILACAVAPVGRNFSNVKMYGTMSGMAATATLNQPLGMIHKLDLGSPVAISVQKQPIKWLGTNAGDVAQRGWWLSVKEPINMGSLVPSEQIDLCPTDGSVTCLYPEFAQKVSQFLSTPGNEANTNSIGGVLLGSGLNVTIGDVVLTQRLTMEATKIQLANQTVVPNCYGGRLFC